MINRYVSRDELHSKAENLVKAYPSDLEDAFVGEFLLFSQMHPGKTSVADMLCTQIEQHLTNSFPNLNIAFRIYLSIFGTSCKEERSFSKLKRINNICRSQWDKTDCLLWH